MFNRLSQVTRHLTRPLQPNFAQPAIRGSLTSSFSGNMAQQQKGLIHTAACLIIGDEVLGGKVAFIPCF